MKTFGVVVGAFAASCARASLLEAIYGSNDLISRDHRHEEGCYFPLDILVVQDMTAHSFADWNQMVHGQLMNLEHALLTTHPNSRFGLITFKDKPLAPFGADDDFCVSYDLPDLTRIDNVVTIKAFLGTHLPSGGGDAPDNQFGALIAAAKSGRIRWNEGHTKLVVLMTDSEPHFAEDGARPQSMVEYSGQFDDSSEQCRNQYYPSLPQVKDALLEQDIYTAFMIMRSEAAGAEGNTVGDNWKYVNKYLGQSDEFVNINEYYQFWEALGKAISKLEVEKCGGKITTTTTATPAATVTTTTTTAATITTTPTATTTTTTAATITTTATSTVTTTGTSTSSTSETTRSSSYEHETTAAAPECNETTFCSDGVFVGAGFDIRQVRIDIDV